MLGVEPADASRARCDAARCFGGARLLAFFVAGAGCDAARLLFAVGALDFDADRFFFAAAGAGCEAERFFFADLEFGCDALALDCEPERVRLGDGCDERCDERAMLQPMRRASGRGGASAGGR